MTQEQKDLLLKDLCARLPYGVICKSVNFKNPTKLVSVDLDGPSHDGGSMWNDYDDIKPYIFPLSSMTEEQELAYHTTCVDTTTEWGYDIYYDCPDSIDWLNKNHFDYRGLIEKGLAIDATGLNIY